MPPPLKSLGFIHGQNHPDHPAIPAKRYFWLGFFLLAALLAEQSTGWRWPALTALQADSVYKQLSGFGLLAFILQQWRLSLLRCQGGQHRAGAMLGRHKALGAMAPLLFFCHSQNLGYGYLQTLSLVFLLVFLTGLCNTEILHVRKPWFRPAWISLHVGLSTALLLLLPYHVYLSYAYK